VRSWSGSEGELTTIHRSRAWLRPGGRIATLLAVAVLAAGCVGAATPTPIWQGPLPTAEPFSFPLFTFPPLPTGPIQASSIAPSPTASQSADLGCAAIVASKHPYTQPEPELPPVVSPSIAAADDRSAAAIDTAVVKLGALRSYRFSADIVGRDFFRFEPSAVDFALQGTLTRSSGLRIDAQMGYRMRETNGSGAAIATSDHVILGGDYVWVMDRSSGVFEPTAAGTIGLAISTMTPDGLAERLVRPFGAGYRRVGVEKHRGVTTVHYRASKQGVAAYAATLQFAGALTADLWIASDGGYLAGASVSGTGTRPSPGGGAAMDDGVLLAFEVSAPDAATNVVDLPVTPVPDPVRPSGPLVDIQLEYRIMPVNGAAPSAKEVDAIAATTRVRLDISNRPVYTIVVKPDRLVVTICNTARAEVDRRIVEADGALTIVPLPASDYGSTTRPGATSLPAIGSRIDPALEPIAPAGPAGLVHVYIDPLTGRRGATFTPLNETADLFRTYAKAHAGEYVAVVLDGVVLATQPIAGHVATGWFAFTGDYTEAETKVLALSLYQPPLGFPLQKLRDVEIPAP
jgi:hypothetical protein